MRLWKKAIAAMTAGVLCVGSVGMTGLQGVLESVGTEQRETKAKAAFVYKRRESMR